MSKNIRKKIVVCDHIHQSGLDMLANASDIEYVFAADEDKTALLDVIADADVAITRSSTDVDDKFLDAVKNLKAVVRAGVGVDNVDIEGSSKKGIIIMNVPTANTIAAVELTMTHLLSTVRRFPLSHDHLKNQRVWKREAWYGTELKGKRLGIIGFGNIGSRVGIRAKAFEMDVVAYDPYINSTKATDLGVEYTENFNDILSCDIITIHTPKNKETINIIDKAEIDKLKDGVVLINCARGGLYNEDALYDGLKSGKIRFAGIDVFNKEPAIDNKLLDLDNIIVSPHLGANTLESQENIAREAASQALDAARGVAYPNALNLPVKEADLPQNIKTFLELTQKIGYFTAQINKGAIQSIQVSASGEIKGYLDSLLTFATVGALSDSIGEKVNYVNAMFVTKDRGISTETKELSDNVYKNKITIKITTSKASVEVSGTIFDENVQRIIDINGFDLDIEPKGKMILFKNTDIPGVIGSVGTILANRNINIADFRLGRKDNLALALINVDNDVDSAILKELEELDASISVEYATI